MNTFFNENTVSVDVYPTVSAGGSVSATFYKMDKHRSVAVQVVGHKLPDEKGEGVATMTVYEHTTSTWAGVATAVTAGVVTGTINSVSNVLLQKELKVSQLSVNESKNYIGVALTLPTSVSIACTITRVHPRYEPQD